MSGRTNCQGIRFNTCTYTSSSLLMICSSFLFSVIVISSYCESEKMKAHFVFYTVFVFFQMGILSICLLHLCLSLSLLKSLSPSLPLSLSLFSLLSPSPLSLSLPPSPPLSLTSSLFPFLFFPFLSLPPFSLFLSFSFFFLSLLTSNSVCYYLLPPSFSLYLAIYLCPPPNLPPPVYNKSFKMAFIKRKIKKPFVFGRFVSFLMCYCAGCKRSCLSFLTGLFELLRKYEPTVHEVHYCSRFCPIKI